MKVCIDIGGTKIRVATISEHLQMSNIKVIKTSNPQQSLSAIVEHIASLKFTQINISTCGPFDIKSGKYGQMPNLKSWSGFNIKAYLKNYFDCPIYLENDANCAALFEAYSRSQIQNLVYITISTGVGAGAIINNKLFTGAHNDAVSPYKYQLDGANTIDDLCSGTGLLKSAQKFATYVHPREVFANHQDQAISEILDQWTTNLALYIINTNSFLEINQFILGGSVIVNNESYMDEIRTKVNRLRPEIEIELTNDINYNGLKGAFLIDKYM